MLKDPTKIHYHRLCNCERIDKINCENDNKQIFYVLEKIWGNKETRKNTTKIFVRNNDKNKQYNADNQIHMLLTDKMKKIRSNVINYFKEYVWNINKSIYIRKNLRNMTTICFCKNILYQNPMTSNAGILLISKHNVILDIAILFEKYIKDTEYERLYCIKISDVEILKEEEMHHILIMFIKSVEYHSIKKLNFYVLIGKSKHDHKYSFAFGKREWNMPQSENSLDCAFRELYEEFNIQISKELYFNSCKYKFPKYIYSPGITIYLIYFKHSKILFHKESKTIYLN